MTNYPDEKSAVIAVTVSGGVWAPTFLPQPGGTCVFGLDGQSLRLGIGNLPASDKDWDAKIAPGIHTADVGYFVASQYSGCLGTDGVSVRHANLTFSAKAGTRYIVRARSTGNSVDGFCTSVRIEDDTTREVVATDGVVCKEVDAKSN